MTRQTSRPLRSRPSVTVVVPCYNYGKFLPECVRSVVAQDGVAVDVVIVDDASPDGSVAVAHVLANADPRVRVLANSVNQGHIRTFEIGLAAVSGDYVLVLSADDMLTPGSLARSVALLEAHPEVSFVYGHPVRFSGSSPPIAATSVRSWSIWLGPEWLGHICRRGGNPIFSPEVVMRTRTMRELAPFEARLPHTQDFYLWMQAATRGAVGRVNGCDQAFYRIHGNNMHLTEFAGALTDLTERRRAFEYFFAENDTGLPDPQRQHERAREALARRALILACRSFDQVESGLPAQFAEFAEQTWPAVRGDRLWRVYERRVTRDSRAQGASLGQWAVRVGDGVARRFHQWRWQRHGI